MKFFNYFVDWFVGGGFIVILGALSPLAGQLMQIKKEHAQTTQAKEAWTMAERVAATVVDSLVSSQAGGKEKFAKATRTVQKIMDNVGYTVTDKVAQTLVQAAYNQSPLTPAPKKEEK